MTKESNETKIESQTIAEATTQAETTAQSTSQTEASSQASATSKQAQGEQSATALDTFIPEPVKVAPSGFWHNFKQILLIFLAALATATAVEIFLLPSNIVIGGALGIASIIDILLYKDGGSIFWTAGVWTVIVNLPILIYCFVAYRRRFAIKTMLYIIFLGGLMVLFRALNLSQKIASLMYGDDSSGDIIIYVLLGGALHGLSLPIMLSVNASTGGSDIVGLIAQKRAKQSGKIAMRTILVTNIAVVLISSIVYYLVNAYGNGVDATTAAGAAVNMFIYSVAAMFIGEIVQEAIFKGFSAAMELEITTEKPAEMVAALQHGLKRGTTTVKVIGGYSHSPKTMILCVVNKQQLTAARRIINKVDDKAFAYVENVREVIGKGFANKELELEDNENGKE